MTPKQRRMDRVRVLLATRNDPAEALLSRPVTSSSSSLQPSVTAPERTTMTQRELDASLARLEADEKRRNGEWGQDDWYDRFEAFQRQHDRSGSYPALERALGKLDEHDRRFILWVYSGLRPQLDWGAKEREKRVVSDLEKLMPGRSFLDIGVPDWVADLELDIEAVEVRTMLDEGATREEIAPALGLSVDAVKRRAGRKVDAASVMHQVRRCGVYWWRLRKAAASR